MEEIETFLNELALQLKEIKRSEKNPVVVAQKHFEYGQFLLSVGKHKESVELLHFSWNALKNFKYDEIYGGLFYSTGVTYAGVLDYLGDIAECERIYAELNTFNAEGFHLGDYAYFLHRRKRDFDNAERAYVKALSLFPSHSSIHLKYAGFLRHVRKNVTKAEEQYKRAIEVNPMNADAIGNYASFLHGVHRNIADAEISYRRAVELDDSHANNLCNYGLFLSEEKSNYEESEKMYQRVLQLTPTHTNTLYNYAVLLDTHLKRKEEAEQYYRLTLDIESRHAYALYNIAVLLEEKYFNSHEASDPPMSEEEKIQDKKHKVEEVTTFYRRAAESDSKDAATIADFGRFIYLHGDNPFQAEAILIAALRINPKSEVALYYLSLLHYKEKPDKAEVMLSELLKISPNHTNANITLSRLLVEKLKSASVNNAPIEQRFVEKVIQMYETVITSSNKESESIVQEYLRFVSEFGSPEQKSHAIKSITPILSRFQRSETKYTRRSSQDLSANINGAAGVNNSSPNPRARRKPLTEVIANCFELLNEIKEQI